MKFTLIIFAVLLTCCNGKKSTDSSVNISMPQLDSGTKVNSNSETSIDSIHRFTDFIDCIREVNVPIFGICGGYETQINNCDYSLLQKYAPQGANIYGKITISDNEIAFLATQVGDIEWPFIYVCDTNGRKLYSKVIKIEGCIHEEFDKYTKYTINEDLSIDYIIWVVKDTVDNNGIITKDRVIIKQFKEY